MKTGVDMHAAIGNIEAKLTVAERAEKQIVNAFVAHGHSWQFEMAEMDAFYAREDATAEILRFHALLRGSTK